MTVNRDLDVTENALIGGDIYAAGDIVGAHVYANTGGTITIGSTTINEEQLKKLLALIG